MPVKKQKSKAPSLHGASTAPAQSSAKTDGIYCAHTTCWAGEFCRKIFTTLLGILLVYVIVYVAALIRNNLKEYESIGRADKVERSITVGAEGKVTATPDIAETTIGMISEGSTVSEAQQKNTEVMNSVITKLKGLGVEKEDLQTISYNIYPLYNYSEKEGRVLNGYEVNQQVSVKIRDLNNANEVLAVVGDAGANSVSGLQFTIDDREVYRERARELALEKVAQKAYALSRALGINLVSVVSYNEFEANDTGVSAYKAFATEGGIGGGLAPQVESGSMDVVINVSVVFEIR